MTTMTPTFAMVIKARLMTLSESHFPLPRNSHQLHEVPETFLFPRSHRIH